MEKVYAYILIMCRLFHCIVDIFIQKSDNCSHKQVSAVGLAKFSPRVQCGRCNGVALTKFNFFSAATRRVSLILMLVMNMDYTLWAHPMGRQSTESYHYTSDYISGYRCWHYLFINPIVLILDSAVEPGTDVPFSPHCLTR